MGDNFYTPWVDETTRFRADEMNAPLVELDLVCTYNRSAIVHCDGDITWNSSTGALAWSGAIRILFTDADGDAVQNTVATGSVTLTDGQMAYVDLNETNDTALTVSAATISTAAASTFLAYNRLVLAFRNTSSDECFPVALKQQYYGTAATKDHGTAAGEVPLNSDLGSISTKTFWSGTQVEYDAISPPDANTIYFIEET
jgi:hypothetical protein